MNKKLKTVTDFEIVQKGLSYNEELELVAKRFGMTKRTSHKKYNT